MLSFNTEHMHGLTLSLYYSRYYITHVSLTSIVCGYIQMGGHIINLLFKRSTVNRIIARNTAHISNFRIGEFVRIHRQDDFQNILLPL